MQKKGGREMGKEMATEGQTQDPNPPMTPLKPWHQGREREEGKKDDR